MFSGGKTKVDNTTTQRQACLTTLSAWKKCRAEKSLRLPTPKQPKQPKALEMKLPKILERYDRQLRFSITNFFKFDDRGVLRPAKETGLKLYDTPLDGPLETLRDKSKNRQAYNFIKKHRDHKLVKDNLGHIVGLINKYNDAVRNLNVVTKDGRKFSLVGSEGYSRAKAKLNFTIRSLQKVISDSDAIEKDFRALVELGSSMDGSANPYMALLVVHFQQMGYGGVGKPRVLGKHKHKIETLIKVPLKDWDDKHVGKLTAELKVARQRFGNFYRFYQHKVAFIKAYEKLNQHKAGWNEARAKVLARYKDEGKMDLLAAIHLGEKLLKTGYQYGPKKDKNKNGTYHVDLMYGMVALAESAYDKLYKGAIDQFYNDIVQAHQGTDEYKAQNKAALAQKAWGKDFTIISDLHQKILAIKSGKLSDREAIKALKALESFVEKRAGGKGASGIKITSNQLNRISLACDFFQSSSTEVRADGLSTAVQMVKSIRKSYQSHMLSSVEKNFSKAKKLPKHLFWTDMRTRVAKRLKEARNAKDGETFLTAYKDAAFLCSAGAQMYVLHTMQENGTKLAREADSQDMFRTAYSFGLARMPGLDKKKFNSSLDVHQALSNLKELTTIYYWGVTPGKKRRFQQLTLNAVHDITKAAASFGKLAKHVKKFKWVSWARDIGVLVYTLALTEVAAIAVGPSLIAGGSRIFFSARSIAALSKIGLQGERAMKAAQLMVRATRFMGISAVGAGLITVSQVPAQMRAGQKLNVGRDFFRHFLTFAMAGPIVGIATRLLRLSSASGFLTEKFFKWVKGGKTTATEASKFARASAAVAQKYGVDDKWVQILLKGGKGKTTAWAITTAMASYKILGSLTAEVAAYFAAGRASHAMLGGHKETLLQQLQGLLMFKALHAGVSPAFSRARQESLQTNIKKINDQVRALEASGTAKPAELMKLSQQGLLLIVEYRALRHRPDSKKEYFKGVASNFLKTYANAASGVAGKGLPAVLIYSFNFANKNDGTIARDFTAKCGKLSKADKAAVEKAYNELSNDPVHARGEMNRVLGKKGFKLDENLQLRRANDNTDYSAPSTASTTAPSGWSRPMRVLRDVLAGLGESLRIAFFPRTPQERAMAQRGAINLGGKRPSKGEGKTKNEKPGQPANKADNKAPREGQPPEGKAEPKPETKDAKNARIYAQGDKLLAELKAKGKAKEMTFEEKLKANKKLIEPEGVFRETTDIPLLIQGRKASSLTIVIVVSNRAARRKLLRALTGSQSKDGLPEGYVIMTKAERNARAQVVGAIQEGTGANGPVYHANMSRESKISYDRHAGAIARFAKKVEHYQHQRWLGHTPRNKPKIDDPYLSNRDRKLLREIKDHPIIQELEAVMTRKIAPERVAAKKQELAAKKVPPPSPAAGSRSGNSAIALLKKAIERQEAYLKQDTFKQLPESAKQIKREQLAADKKKLKELEASSGSPSASPASGEPAGSIKQRSPIDSLKFSIQQAKKLMKSDGFKDLPELVRKNTRDRLEADKAKLKELETKATSKGSPANIERAPSSDSTATNPGHSLAKARAPKENKPAGERRNPTVIIPSSSAPRPAHTPTPTGQGKPESVAKKLVDGAKTMVSKIAKDDGLKSLLFLGFSLALTAMGIPVAFGMIAPLGRARTSLKVKGSNQEMPLVEGQVLRIGDRGNGPGARGQVFIDQSSGLAYAHCDRGSLTVVRTNGHRVEVPANKRMVLAENDRIQISGFEYTMGRMETAAPQTTSPGMPQRIDNRVAPAQAPSPTTAPGRAAVPAQPVSASSGAKSDITAAMKRRTLKDVLTELMFHHPNQRDHLLRYWPRARRIFSGGLDRAAASGTILAGARVCRARVTPGRVIVNGKEVKMTTPQPQAALPKTLKLSKSKPSEITIRDKRGSTHFSTIPGTDVTIRIKTVDGHKHYFVTNNGTSTVQVKNSSGRYVNVPQGKEFPVTNDNHIRISEGRSRQFVKVKIEL